MTSAARRVAAVFALLCACVTASAAQSGPPADLDAWVARAMKEFETPGLALAIVKDGRVVVAKGYGVKNLQTHEPVDADTLFGIASNTKAFTASALAMLVDEGKISWDDHAIDHLPQFQLSDPYVTREITVRDLLTHRSGLGLGAGDLMYFPRSDLTREQVIHSQRYLKLASSFRSKYAYDNALFMVAGQIIPAVTGTSWDEFVRRRIFDPLGMKNSNTSYWSLPKGANVATPHAHIDGKLQPVEADNIDNTAPAGAIVSSAADLARWMVLRLNMGDLGNGRRLFSEKQAKEMWTGQTIIPISDYPPALAELKPHFVEYGLGQVLRDYHGYQLVHHSGGLTGYLSQLYLVPEQKLGVLVMINGDVGEPCLAVVYHVLDHYLKTGDKDWIAAFAATRKEREDKAEDTMRKQAGARNAASKPSLPLNGYTGEYRDAWYGPAKVGLEEGTLVMRFSHSPGLVGKLEHWQYDTFVAKWIDKTVPDAFVTFSLGAEGKVKEITLKPVSPLADFSYDFQDLLFTPAGGKDQTSN